MSLTEYKSKRNFHRTPEPADNGAPRGLSRFVVQKHDASRLHYDFRLELDGTLKSWAVPKGPSLDPSLKSLAVHVEDHPLAYGDFEGVIPAGEYGGGTVMVWDQGTWEPEGDPLKAYKQGKLSFKLQGQKLKGKWTLVRMGGRAGEGGKNWLLIKSNDRSASKTKDILAAKPRSVLSGRDLAEIAADSASTGSKRAGAKQRRGAGRRPTSIEPTAERAKPAMSPEKAVPLTANELARRAGKLSGARKRKQPTDFKPQLATLGTAVPTGDGWIHEMKFDGYRLLAFYEQGGVRLITRNGKDWTHKFPTVANALRALSIEDGILDGEIVYMNEQGVSNFQMLQNTLKRGNDHRVCYYLFDVPHCAGYDLTSTPLGERKQLLSSLLAAAGQANDAVVRMSDHIVGRGKEVLANACRLGLEGIISKRAGSSYSQSRASTWVKAKCHQRQEFVICGYTEPTGARIGFGALLLGYYDEDKLVYAGRVGTGFNSDSLRRLHQQLRQRQTRTSPLAEPLSGTKSRGVTWVRPELVCEVEFTEWTDDGLLRHPSFQGLREDKPVDQVVREKAVPVGTSANGAKKQRAKR